MDVGSLKQPKGAETATDFLEEEPKAEEPIVAEGMTLAQIKRKLPIAFDPETVRIEDGKIIAYRAKVKVSFKYEGGK